MLVSDDAARGRAALSLALAQAALGRPVRLYAHERAVALLVESPRDDDDSAALAAAGIPDRQAMLAMARESGITLIACQTGLALTGLSIDDLTDGVEAGGLIGLIVQRPTENLLVF